MYSKDVSPRFVAGRVGPTPDALPLQQLEEALSDGVVVAVAAPAHAGLEAVLAEKRLPFTAGELGALVRMYHDLSIGFASPDRHQHGPARPSPSSCGIAPTSRRHDGRTGR